MSTIADRVVRLKDFQPQLATGVQEWTAKARDALRSTDNFVRSSPWQAAGLIAVAALAAGFLASRSRRAQRRGASTGNDWLAGG
jgi:ElaB/YqjD/DUF883 family membrane-anchored ribosome-binding protein